MIRAIFFVRFHTERGSQILHQVPSNAVSGPADPTSPPLFDFKAIESVLVPPESFSERLVTVCINRYRVIGCPVRIAHQKYERNEYIFNFCMVLDEDADFTPYTNIVKKLANTFKNLEEQTGFLSTEEGVKFRKQDRGEHLPTAEDSELESTTTEESSAHGDHVPDESKEPAQDQGEGDEAKDSDSQLLSNSKSDIKPSAVKSAIPRVYQLCETIMEDLNNYQELMLPTGKCFRTFTFVFSTYPWFFLH